MICPVWPCASQIVWSGAMNSPHGVPGCLIFADVIAVGVEHLDAGVVAVGDVEQALGVEHQRMRQVELARAFAFLPQVLMQLPSLSNFSTSDSPLPWPCSTNRSPVGPTTASFGSLNSRR